MGQWGGLDQRLVIDENAFSDMRNMSTRYFPAIATREPRSSSFRSIATPRGMAFKNAHLFYISGTQCYWMGNPIDGMTVTEGDKQIVSMGAYIIVFPDKLIFNSHTGEVTGIDATYTQSGSITFDELSTDSVFCKITAAGIDGTVKKGDGVTFYGINDDAFLVDGQPATKVVTEVGSGYIVVTAPIQETFTGKVKVHASNDNGETVVTLQPVTSKFKPGDLVTISGSKDPDLNFEKIEVKRNDILPTGQYLHLRGTFPAKNYTQSRTIIFSAYYTGSNLTRIYADDLGSIFSEDDVVTIAGCTGSAAAYNGANIRIRQAGTNYILVDGTLASEITQPSGITITRTSAWIEPVTIKRNQFTRAAGVSIKRESQSFDYVCEHDNRLWACNNANHEIYASKLGDPTNWQCYEGISTDSYTVTIGSDGDFTGCCSYMGQVLFFKEQTIHMLYGNKPSNYQLSEMHMPGVRSGCAGSIAVVDQTLYYVGRGGVYRFDGASPQKISDQITMDITQAVACQQGGKYYVSFYREDAAEYCLLVYDPRYQIWMREDTTQFQFAAYEDGKLYYIDGANQLRTVTGDGAGEISWRIVSGDLRESSLDQKWIGKAKFNLWLDAGAEANIYFQFDEDPIWHRAATIHSVTSKTYTVPIVPQRCSRFRWRMEGKGQMKLLAMGISVERGSEINGNLQSWFRR